MSTSICIDTSKGQDCLEFSRVDGSQSRRWQLTGFKSRVFRRRHDEESDPVDSGRMNRGSFFVSHSAYDQKI